MRKVGGRQKRRVGKYGGIQESVVGQISGAGKAIVLKTNLCSPVVSIPVNSALIGRIRRVLAKRTALQIESRLMPAGQQEKPCREQYSEELFHYMNLNINCHSAVILKFTDGTLQRG